MLCAIYNEISEFKRIKRSVSCRGFIDNIFYALEESDIEPLSDEFDEDSDLNPVSGKSNIDPKSSNDSS
ncbi:hypothetical protein EVAR_51929_1 [Eumeta japonica]|uniref:Uncharacterized protein n=1 Tax=Eumeta variegata TaxID=151549 RepID=A0A4C1XHN6_EUMVA|nr:hypothetical protein EVAR_51929_1 [Eumeta japonica]